MTIESEGVAGRGFASVNLESKSAGIKTEDQLYDCVRGHLSDKGRTYVFIDEPQRIEGWQDAVNAMRVDFAAVKDGRVLYVQATDEMRASETREREIAPLKSIRDNHEKIVVARQGSYDTDIDGIRIVSARDFSSKAMRSIVKRPGQVGNNAWHRAAIALCVR